MFLPKWYSAIEEGFQSLLDDQPHIQTETERAIITHYAEVVADLMSFYNDAEIKDYTVFQKSVEYLQEVVNNSKTPEPKRVIAEEYFNSILPVLAENNLIASVISM